MRSFLFAFLAFTMAFASSAKMNGDGYYRVKNNRSGRYVYVMDNRGSLDFQSSTAEVGAIELWLNHDKTISDPASIMYITDLTGKNQDFDIQTQGTGIKTMIDYPVTIYYHKSDDNYSIYGRNSGMTRWLGDATKNSYSERGYVSTTDTGEWTRWQIYPLSSSTDEYFGISPEIKVGEAYYAPFFADFPFNTVSSGMEVFYISKVDDDVAVIKPINGIVPRATPVLIKCATNQPTTNRIEIGGSANAVTDNVLKGVYFENYDNLIHNNLTPYNKSTMRVLGTNSAGELAFVTADLDYVPRNKAYLPVPASSPEQIRILTQDEYNDYVANKKYTLTYKVDGVVYKTYELKAGTAITPEAEPEREGYTFSGWEGLPEVMPANHVTVNGTFSINTYHLFYYVDGEIYKRSYYKYGETIIPEPEPTREGWTFPGWGELPETMPAQNLYVGGYFYKNLYTLTFMVDDEVYYTTQVKFENLLPDVEAPVKEGHTFIEWTGKPLLMPAHDLTLYANFSVNSYNLNVYLDNVKYSTSSVKYGDPVILPELEIAEGRTFDHWAEDIPEVMPAHDVDLHGFTISGIDDILADITESNVDVYTLTGKCILKNASKDEVTRLLAPGIYVIAGHKVMVK